MPLKPLPADKEERARVRKVLVALHAALQGEDLANLDAIEAGLGVAISVHSGEDRTSQT